MNLARIVLLIQIAAIACGCAATAPRGARYVAPSADRVAQPLQRTGAALDRARARAVALVTPPAPAAGEPAAPLPAPAKAAVTSIIADLDEARAGKVDAEVGLSAMREEVEKQTQLLNATTAERDTLKTERDAACDDAADWKKRYRDEFGLWARIKSHFWSALIGGLLGAGGIIALFVTGKLAALGARLGLKGATGI